MTGCLEASGLPFVGLPDRTDHPLGQSQEYRDAVSACEAEPAMTQLLVEQGTWQSGLDLLALLELYRTGEAVHACVINRGWDIGSFGIETGNVLLFSRFPGASLSQLPSWMTDLESCGWYALNLGP